MDKQHKDQEKNEALGRAAEELLSVEERMRRAASMLGRIGGKATGDSKRRPSEMCRQAVAKRWDAYRRRKALGASQEGKQS